MKKEKSRLLGVRMTAEQKAGYQKECADHILRYLWVVFVLLMGIQFFNLFHALIYTNWTLHTTASRVYAVLYTLMILVSAGCLLFWRSAVKGKKTKPGTVLGVQTACGGFILLWGLCITLYDQRVSENINTYLIVTLTVAALACLKPVHAVILFGTAQILLLLLLPVFQPEPMDNFGVYVNSTVMVIMAVFMNCYKEMTGRRRYLDQQLILEQSQDIRRKNELLNQMLERDSLTGLLSRRFLDWKLGEIYKNCAEEGEYLTVMMIDIDNFKEYNDTFGHQRGDECLRQVADTCRSCLNREGEYVIRYGGEEFLYVGKGVESRAALEKGREFCQAIRSMEMPPGAAEKRHITVSIGIYTGEPELSADAGGWTHFISRADNALYTAKRNGKDQAVSYKE